MATESTTMVKCFGEVKTVQQLSEEYYVNINTLIRRIDNGWLVEDAVKLSPNEGISKYGYTNIKR